MSMQGKPGSRQEIQTGRKTSNLLGFRRKAGAAKMGASIPRGKLFRRFLASYLLMLVLPLILTGFVYAKALDTIEHDATEARFFMLRQCRTILDNYLRNMDETILSLSLNTNLRTLMSMDQPDYGSPDIFYVAETQKEIKAYKLPTTFEATLHVYLRQPDITLTRETVDFGIQTYYDNNLLETGDPFTDWSAATFGEYRDRSVVAVGNRIDTEGDKGIPAQLSYVQSMPIGNPQVVQGAIEARIRTEGINRMLQDVHGTTGGFTYILDRDGRFLTGSMQGMTQAFGRVSIEGSKLSDLFRTRIGGTDMVVLYQRSDYNGWTYVTGIPERVFLDKAHLIRRFLLVSGLAAVLIGLSLSILLSRQNSRPLLETMLTLRKVFQGEPGGGQNEYEFLKNGVNRLAMTQETMKRSMEDQEILMRSTFLNRLLRGEINDAAEIGHWTAHLGISLEGKRHAAAILFLNRVSAQVRPENLLEQDINRVIMENAIRRHLGENACTQILDTDRMALLMNLDCETEEACRELATRLLGEIRLELQETFGIPIRIGVGGFYPHPEDLYLSFGEAGSTLAHLEDATGSTLAHPEDAGGVEGIVHYRDIPSTQFGYYYPLELELQLANLVRTGNLAEIDRILNLVRQENFVRRHLTQYMEYNLFFEMRGTLLKILGDQPPRADLQEMLGSSFSNRTVDAVFTGMRDVYAILCEEVESRKRSHNTELQNALVKHVEDNFFSPELSASDIARRFGISESYFSQFFKEQMGETFSDFLEKKRINRACELLVGKDLSVEDTARLVGYNSAYTFRRAFKRVTGVLPTAYRG